MTLHELVGSFATTLNTALSCPVAKYQRLDPPTVLRVQVIEGAEGEGGEHANDLNLVSGGTHFQRMHLTCIVETPWDEDETTAAALDAVVETIKTTIYANRVVVSTGDDADVGRYDGQEPFFLQYPGYPNSWIKGRFVHASWRV